MSKDIVYNSGRDRGEYVVDNVMSSRPFPVRKGRTQVVLTGVTVIALANQLRVLNSSGRKVVPGCFSSNTIDIFDMRKVVGASRIVQIAREQSVSTLNFIDVRAENAESPEFTSILRIDDNDEFVRIEAAMIGSTLMAWVLHGTGAISEIDVTRLVAAAPRDEKKPRMDMAEGEKLGAVRKLAGPKGPLHATDIFLAPSGQTLAVTEEKGQVLLYRTDVKGATVLGFWTPCERSPPLSCCILKETAGVPYIAVAVTDAIEIYRFRDGAPIRDQRISLNSPNHLSMQNIILEADEQGQVLVLASREDRTIFAFPLQHTESGAVVASSVKEYSTDKSLSPFRSIIVMPQRGSVQLRCTYSDGHSVVTLPLSLELPPPPPPPPTAPVTAPPQPSPPPLPTKDPVVTPPQQVLPPAQAAEALKVAAAQDAMAEAEISRLKQQVEGLQSKTRTQEDQIGQLSKAVADKDAELARLQQRIKDLEKENASLLSAKAEIKVEAKNQVEAQLREVLVQVGMTCTAMKERYSAISNRIENLEEAMKRTMTDHQKSWVAVERSLQQAHQQAAAEQANLAKLDREAFEALTQQATQGLEGVRKELQEKCNEVVQAVQRESTTRAGETEQVLKGFKDCIRDATSGEKFQELQALVLQRVPNNTQDELNILRETVPTVLQNGIKDILKLMMDATISDFKASMEDKLSKFLERVGEKMEKFPAESAKEVQLGLESISKQAMSLDVAWQQDLRDFLRNVEERVTGTLDVVRTTKLDAPLGQLDQK
eukprot:Sspe_Gene.4470::Locus_1472_Transcript_1_2_Confidence_0.750_Length_2819::g.4470::m.4470